MKHLFRIFVFSIYSFSLAFAGDSPNWQVDGVTEGWKNESLALQYFHNSELQRQWAWHLLGQHPLTGKEHVLDFGCGDGKITAEISHFLPHGRILGVDLSPFMITFAQRCFPTAHYPNLTFEQTNDVNLTDVSVGNGYDFICSFCVFHLVPDPIKILKNLGANLAEDGKLLLVIPSGKNAALFQAAGETFKKYQLPSPWASKSSESTINMRTTEGCMHCLTEADLEPISIMQLDVPTAFFNKQELVEWMAGTMSANWQVPFEQASPFFNDLVDRMAELDPDVINKSGGYYMKLSRIEVVAKLSSNPKPGNTYAEIDKRE